MDAAARSAGGEVSVLICDACRRDWETCDCPNGKGTATPINLILERDRILLELVRAFIEAAAAKDDVLLADAFEAGRELLARVDRGN